MLHAVSPVVADNPDDLIGDAPAPLIGQHTYSVLQQFGSLSEKEIRDLEQKGVVRGTSAATEMAAVDSTGPAS
jgi:hypothetical protein